MMRKSVFWTIAYRTKQTRGLFHRINLSLTWHQALDVAGYLESVLNVPVFAVPTATHEAEYPSTTSGFVYVENVLEAVWKTVDVDGIHRDHE